MNEAVWTKRLNSWVYLRLVVSENINSGNNTSTVNWELRIISDYAFGSYNFNNNFWYVDINGSRVASGRSTYNLYGVGSSKLLSSGTTGAITHDTDGSKAINVKGYYDEQADLIDQTYILTNFTRLPLAPASCTATVNPDKTITVNSGTGTNYGSSVTYRVQIANSSDNYATWRNAAGTLNGNDTMTNRAFTYSGLLPGRSYRFRTFIVDTEGTGPTTQSIDYFLPSGGKRYDTLTGTYIPTQTAKRYDSTSSSWITITNAKRYDAALGQWVNLS